MSGVCSLLSSQHPDTLLPPPPHTHTYHRPQAMAVPVVGRMPFMIFGADVTHPTSFNENDPSIAAVCASYDRTLGRYMSRVLRQVGSCDVPRPTPSLHLRSGWGWALQAKAAVSTLFTHKCMPTRAHCWGLLMDTLQLGSWQGVQFVYALSPHPDV